MRPLPVERACDFVINGWLVEMGIATVPQVGLLYDPALKGESAEVIYDRIVTDMRRYRKLATLRGVGVGDILVGAAGDGMDPGGGMDLDDFYRRCLAQGLLYHEDQSRGFLPAGLIEEIQAIGQPPIASPTTCWPSASCFVMPRLTIRGTWPRRPSPTASK